MVVMASDGPSPHSPSLHLGLPALKPSRRHHTQSLLSLSFHDPRTHHVLESHPKRAEPLSRHDDERCHAIGSHSALALRLYLLQPTTPPQVVAFESWTISAPICLNRFTPFPFLAPWPSRPPAIQTPPRPVPPGPLISLPRNASCSRIPPGASRASLPPRR